MNKLKIRLIGLLCVVSFVTTKAQINRFFYELSYASSSKDSIKKELMVLDISQEKSVFQSYLNVSQDSIIMSAVNQMQKTGNPDISKFGVKLSNFKYHITKKYPIDNIIYKEKLLNDVFQYEEKIDWNWKLQNKYDKIDIYNVQLAISEFGGRTWLAWFCNDLPFPDGPYKFYGLPGLILKISDSEDLFNFSFVGNKNIKENTQSVSEMFLSGPLNKTSKSKFNKIYKNFKEDPIGSLRPMLSNPDFTNKKLPDGTSFIEFIRIQEKKMKNDLNKNKFDIEKYGN